MTAVCALGTAVISRLTTSSAASDCHGTVSIVRLIPGREHLSPPPTHAHNRAQAVYVDADTLPPLPVQLTWISLPSGYFSLANSGLMRKVCAPK